MKNAFYFTKKALKFCSRDILSLVLLSFPCRSLLNLCEKLAEVRPSKIDCNISGPNVESWYGMPGFNFIFYSCKSLMKPNLAFWYIFKWVVRTIQQIHWNNSTLKRKWQFEEALLIIKSQNIWISRQTYYIRFNTSPYNFLLMYSFCSIIWFFV